MFTFGTIRTKATHIVETNHPPDMPMPATWTMFAESSIIPRTVLYFGLWINVKVLAFFVAAFPKLGIKVAFRHLCHVILMEKFTLITFFTEPSQPVLTHHCLFTLSVSKWTECPSVTHVSCKIFTNSCTRLCETRK